MSNKLSNQEGQNCSFRYKEWDVEFDRKDSVFYFSKSCMAIPVKRAFKIDLDICFEERYFFTTGLDFYDYFIMRTYNGLKNSGQLTTKYIEENLFLYSIELLIILNFYLEKEARDRFFFLVKANNMEILKVWKDVFYEDMSFEEILAQVLVIFQ